MTDASPGLPERPLSPHMTVWRWHVTMLTSILHRATGVALYGGALIAAGWALSLAGGPESYGLYMSLLGSWLGRIVMFGLTLALFFHLAKGLQHLMWDFGAGLDLRTSNLTAVAALAFSLAATIAVWVIAALTGAI